MAGQESGKSGFLKNKKKNDGFEGIKNVKNGLKRVQVGDGGLKLWEHDALTLISSFRQVLDRKPPTNPTKTVIFTPHSSV